MAYTSPFRGVMLDLCSGRWRGAYRNCRHDGEGDTLAQYIRPFDQNLMPDGTIFSSGRAQGGGRKT